MCALLAKLWECCEMVVISLVFGKGYIILYRFLLFYFSFLSFFFSLSPSCLHFFGSSPSFLHLSEFFISILILPFLPLSFLLCFLPLFPCHCHNQLPVLLPSPFNSSVLITAFYPLICVWKIAGEMCCEMVVISLVLGKGYIISLYDSLLHREKITALRFLRHLLLAPLIEIKT